MLNGWKTIIAAVIGILFTALPMIGIEVGDVDQARVTESVMGLVDRAIIIAAFAGTIWGRLVAKRRVLTDKALK